MPTAQLFAKPYKKITISSGEDGSVTVPGEGVFTYIAGTTITITATPSAEATFAVWTGTAVDAGKVAETGEATTTVQVSDNYTLIASFLPAA